MSSNEDYIRKNKVEIVDDDKNTKLHYAAALGNLEQLEKIIQSGQKLDPENYLGWTPLMMAVKSGNNVAADLLLTKGADATKKNKFGINVFLISVTSGDLDLVTKILNHLLSGGVSRQSLQRVISPISLAILFGHGHIFKYLLERSFNPNTPTPLTGLTPIMFAAALSNNRAIKRLLQFKADITLRNCLGKTASDILFFKQQKTESNCLKSSKGTQPPIIVVSHPQNGTAMQLTPVLTSLMECGRKSSNLATPNSVCTPTVSPISLPVTPQIFFGPDFNAVQLINQSVTPPLPFQASFLNAAVTPSSVFFSPVPQHMCVPNYM